MSIDSAWADRVRAKGWTKDSTFEDPALEQLKQKLLAIDGWAVCLAFSEPDLEKIMENGELRDSESVEMIPGERSACHQNSANLFRKNRSTMRIVTGYALTDDGMWRQHSWCTNIDKPSRLIYETTERRTAYFGYQMTLEECEEFEPFV